MSEARVCLDCGHVSCPRCGAWCDRIVWVAYCVDGACDAKAIVGTDHASKHPLTCGECWGPLELEPELCCDGECRYGEAAP